MMSKIDDIREAIRNRRDGLSSKLTGFKIPQIPQGNKTVITGVKIAAVVGVGVAATLYGMTSYANHRIDNWNDHPTSDYLVILPESDSSAGGGSVIYYHEGTMGARLSFSQLEKTAVQYAQCDPLKDYVDKAAESSLLKPGEKVYVFFSPKIEAAVEECLQQATDRGVQENANSALDSLAHFFGIEQKVDPNANEPQK